MSYHDDELPTKYAAQIKLLGGMRKFLNNCLTRELTVTISLSVEDDPLKDAVFRNATLVNSLGETFKFSIRKDKR